VGTVTERVELELDEYSTLTLLHIDEPSGSNVLPIIRGVAVAPGVIAPGEGMGIRESITVQCADIQFAVAGTEYESGTLWPKIRAIYGTLRGRRLRYVIDIDGVTETRHYLIDALSVVADGATITARDDLWTLASTMARAPDASPGRTTAPVAELDSSLTLTPSGVGDGFYRPAGVAVLGGSEVVRYTRSGDVLTLAERAMHGTVSPATHEADSTVQEILEFNTGSAHDVSLADFNAAGLEVPQGFTWHGGRPAEILSYLLVRYGRIDPSIIPLASWYAETDRNYGARIAQPEGVGVLVGELIQQAGLAMWADSVLSRIHMRALVNISGAAPLGADRVANYSCRDQSEKQVTECWAYWGQINPTERIDEKKNYRAIQLGVASDVYPELDGTDRHIRTMMCRWVNTQANAEWLVRMMLARYATPPREFTGTLHRSDPAYFPSMGQRVALGHYSLQNVLGAEQSVLAQVISIRPAWDTLTYQLEELDLRALQTEPGFQRVVYLVPNDRNVNLRTLHDIQYADPVAGDNVLFILEQGNTVGSAVPGRPAVIDGEWPAGVTRTLWVQPGASIEGRGGDGMHAYAEGAGAFPGNVGLEVVTSGLMVRNEGTIAGGGGGAARRSFAHPLAYGQSYPGGGGDGTDPGLTGGPGVAGFEAPWSPGGALGQPGPDGLDYNIVFVGPFPTLVPFTVPGGAAGKSVVGYDNVTWLNEGTLLGPIVP
jgi:hypothetical protein